MGVIWYDSVIGPWKTRPITKVLPLRKVQAIKVEQTVATLVGFVQVQQLQRAWSIHALFENTSKWIEIDSSIPDDEISAKEIGLKKRWMRVRSPRENEL
jgi:hypothetical protein